MKMKMEDRRRLVLSGLVWPENDRAYLMPGDPRGTKSGVWVPDS